MTVPDEDFSHLLGELKASADVLNQELDAVPEIIAGVERQLQKLALTLEAWLEDHPLRTHELSVSASNVAPNIETQLGYAPRTLGAQVEWRLQLRDAEYSPRLAPSGDYHERELMRIQRRVNLVDASREDRLSALGQLPTLIRHLIAATKERTDTIRTAKHLLDELENRKQDSE